MSSCSTNRKATMVPGDSPSGLVTCQPLNIKPWYLACASGVGLLYNIQRQRRAQTVISNATPPWIGRHVYFSVCKNAHDIRY